jgi:Zn-dependent peptidase ImmA (M78 family)
MVMRSGVVGTNTHRPLNPEEFRGFALFDEIAPLVFVNSGDFQTAQMFTLAHEIAHIWIGTSALDDLYLEPPVPMERLCNTIAAELLVPMEEFAKEWTGLSDGELHRLSKLFRVSRLVIAIRAHEAGLISKADFAGLYSSERLNTRKGTSGGNFLRTQHTRLGTPFISAVTRSANQGTLLLRDAYELLDVKKHDTFVKLANSLEY